MPPLSPMSFASEPVSDDEFDGLHGGAYRGAAGPFDDRRGLHQGMNQGGGFPGRNAGMGFGGATNGGWRQN